MDSAIGREAESELGAFERWVWYLNIAATVALVVRFSVDGLFRVYRLFFLYLLIDILQQVLRLVFLSNLNRTVEIYMAGQTVKVVLAVFVLLELYRLALAEQPALARFGRQTVSGVLGAAAVIAAVGLVFGSTPPPGRSVVVARFYSFERTMDAWLLIFLILVCLFMTWFPVRMKRNVALYLGGFVVYFFSHAAGLLLVSILPTRFRIPLSIALLCVSLICLLVWLFTLRREGEEATTVIGHRWNPAAIQQLTGQLDSINASLMRLSRRKLR